MVSELVQDIGEAGSIRVNQMVYDQQRRGRDVVVLSLGEAFFDIPMFDFNRLDFVKGYHYSDTRGLPKLREKLSSYYRERFDVASDPQKHVLVSAGSKMIIYMSILATVNPGDEVVIHEPYWLSYPEQIKLCRAIPKVVPYWVKGAAFRSYITSRTRLVILNNPNNPAGSVYSREDLTAIYGLCRDHDAHLLVDEAYGDFCLRDEFTSAGLLARDFQNVIVVNSLSKSMGMSGWRIGYMFGHETLVSHTLRLNQHLITCAPTILAQYCAEYFDEILHHTLPQARDVVKKRERISGYMDAIGLKYLEGPSTFYFFVDISKSGKSSVDFAESLLRDHSIAVVPGSCYGQSTDKFVRVSVGTETEERIQKALSVIHDVCV